MTVAELKEYLEDLDDDLEVRTMSQPSWPFEYAVSHVLTRKDITDNGDDGEEEGYVDPDGKENCVFLVEGRQICYGSKRAWDR